jgi:hypothetical protein
MLCDNQCATLQKRGGEKVKFQIRVYIPSYYEVEADTQQEAEEKAVYIFEKENCEWIGPENEIFELISEALPLP